MSTRPMVLACVLGYSANLSAQEAPRQNVAQPNATQPSAAPTAADERSEGARAPRPPDPAPAVVMPQLLRPLEPEYPTSGLGDASVVLHVTLDPNGAVREVIVKEGTEPFASAALRAARNARFSPALRAGVPVAARITVVVEFEYAGAEGAAGGAAAENPVAGAAPRAAGDRAPPGITPASGAASAGTADTGPAEAAALESYEIVVSAARVDQTERQIHRAEARLVAGTFGDPLRAVELLPGITPLIGGVPYFFVRGAPAGSVAFMVDEASVPQLYHVGPGSSILHPQLVQGVSLHSGPYRARYGNATSGVITTRVVTDLPAHGAEVEGKAFESSAYYGAPIARTGGAVAVAGKISHLRPLLELVNPELHLRYWDYQLLASHAFTARDQLGVLVFGAGDFVGQERQGEVDIDLDSVFHRIKLGYNKNLDAGLDLHTTLILGSESTRFDAEDEKLSARSLGFGTSLHHVIDSRWEWATGLSAEAKRYDASEAEAYWGQPHNAAVDRVDAELGLWGEARYSPLDSVHLDAGVRVSGYQSKHAAEAALEPRLSSTLEHSRSWSSTWAVGYSTQTPSAGVPAPAVKPAELRGGLQQALQRAVTLRHHAPFVLTTEATLYYNDYAQLSDPLALATVPDPLEVGEAASGEPLPEESLNFVDRPSGRSYGLELLLRRPFTNRLSGTLSYTLSRSTRKVASDHVPSSFDRTHVLNTTAGYDLGSGYRLSARLMLYSGLPVRRVSEVGADTGERSDGFTRVDLRFSKEWQLGWMDLMLIAEMLNATFEKEVLGVSCTEEGCITASFGPVSVPSVGLRGTFGSAARDVGDRTQIE